jgi:type II secretory pathway component PulJ
VSALARVSRTGDAGFTLIELLITFLVLGTIFVPLTAFFVQYLHTYNQTEQRLSDSHDLQVAAVYFGQDVANTGLRNQAAGQTTFAPQQSVWTTGPWSSFCGTTLTGTPVLLLKWDEESVGSGAGSDTVDSVEYLITAGALHRRSCRQPPTGAPTLAPDTTLVYNLSGTPVVACSTSCTAATPPTTITLTLNVQSGSTDTAGTPLTLTGQRRQSQS